TRQFQLTSVCQNSDEGIVGYLGIDDQDSEWALSTAEAVAAVTAGLKVFVKDASGEASAVAVTRLGRLYLRTIRDQRLTDNIGELPVVDGLPDKRGIGLS